jgi:hypothetical protein
VVPARSREQSVIGCRAVEFIQRRFFLGGAAATSLLANDGFIEPLIFRVANHE